MRTAQLLIIVLWLTTTGSSVFGASYYFTKFGTPFVVGERIIFAGPGWEPHRVICIGRRDGKKLWEISDSTNSLHPVILFDQKVFIAAGSQFDELDPQNGNRKAVLQTGYQRPSLRFFADEVLLCAGESKGNLKLGRFHTKTWQRMWETTGIERVIAAGKDTLLCEWITRRPAGAGAFQILAAGYAGIAKSSGKELWRLAAPSAVWLHGVAVKDWFVMSLGDETLCVRQDNGLLLTRIKSPAGPPGVSLANQGDHVVVWSCAARGSFTGRVFKLSVPSLDESDLFPTDFFPTSHAIYNDIVIGHSIGRVDAYSLAEGKKLWRGGQWYWNGVHDGDIYFSEQESDRKHTSVNRLNVTTGDRERLYQELLPKDAP